jgi:hypothetical protein
MKCTEYPGTEKHGEITLRICAFFHKLNREFDELLTDTFLDTGANGQSPAPK